MSVCGAHGGTARTSRGWAQSPPRGARWPTQPHGAAVGLGGPWLGRSSCRTCGPHRNTAAAAGRGAAACSCSSNISLTSPIARLGPGNRRRPRHQTCATLWPKQPSGCHCYARPAAQGHCICNGHGENLNEPAWPFLTQRPVAFWPDRSWSCGQRQSLRPSARTPQQV